MTLSKNLSNMVSSFIKREGKPCTVTFVSSEQTDYDPTGNTQIVSPTTTNVATSCAFLPYAILSHGNQNRYGTLVEENDYEVYLIHNTGFPRTPNPDVDYITANGEKWIIKVVKEVAPDGVNRILYNCLVRK